MSAPTTLALPLRALAVSVLLHGAVGVYALVKVRTVEARADWADSASAPQTSFQLSLRGPEPTIEPAPVAMARPWSQPPDLSMPEPEPELENGPALPKPAEQPPRWPGTAALPMLAELRAPSTDRYQTPIPPAHSAIAESDPVAAEPTPPPPASASADAPVASIADAALVAASPSAGHNPDPRYPSRARRQGQEGTVTVALEIDAEGNVTAAKVAASSGHPLLDAEAVRCLSSWRFEPARRLGVAVHSRLEQQVVFRLIS